MGCCGGRSASKVSASAGSGAAPRYKRCPKCQSPIRRRLRYDPAARGYVEVEICPVCSPEGRR